MREPNGASTRRRATVTPTTSIVVPVFNGEGVIGECLRSLLAMDAPGSSFEVVVVDNGSTDGTCDIVRSLGDAVRLLHEPRRGAGAARNRGISEARGRLVAFTDADCTADPNWLPALIAPLEDPAVGVVGGAVLSRRPCNRIELFGERIHNQRAAIEQVSRPYVATGNWGSRRDVLVEAGLFDITLLRGQDVDLSWRIHHAGYRLAYAPGARVYHRNEGTLRGLLREGFEHGLGSVQVRDRSSAAGMPVRQRSYVRSRLARDIRLLMRSPDRVEAALQTVFDLGKSWGEVMGLLRARQAAQATTSSSGGIPA